MEVNLYIKSNLTGPAVRPEGKYLWLLVYQTKERKSATMEGYGTIKNANEYRLELIAICKALRRIKVSCDINIYSDCHYIKNSFRYLKSWAESDWKNSKGEIKNLAQWVEIWSRTDRQQVTVTDLKGSSYSYWMNFEIKKLNK